MKIYEDIKKDKDKIIESANNGSSLAKNIIGLHKLCVESADRITITLLKCTYKDWSKNERLPADKR